MSNYPPGVSGNEPEITGEYPCPKCDGQGHDEEVKCWFCDGKGVAPEEAPPCPGCGTATEFVPDSYDEKVYCPDCKEVS